MDSNIELADRIGVDLQRLEDVSKNSNIKIRFPRGVLRRASNFEDNLLFIKNETLRSNLAYHLMLCDVYNWILTRFDIKFTAEEMLIKENIVVTGNICEGMVVHLTQISGFKPAVKFLAKEGKIDKDLKEGLLWLWGVRCKCHLTRPKELEFRKYGMTHFNNSRTLLNQLLVDLQKLPAPEEYSIDLDNLLLSHLDGITESDDFEDLDEADEEMSEWDYINDLGDYNPAGYVIDKETDVEDGESD